MRLVCIEDYHRINHIELPDDKNVGDLYDEYCKWHRSVSADTSETPFFDFLRVKGYKTVDVEVFWT